MENYNKYITEIDSIITEIEKNKEFNTRFKAIFAKNEAHFKQIAYTLFRSINENNAKIALDTFFRLIYEDYSGYDCDIKKNHKINFKVLTNTTFYFTNNYGQ